MSPLLPNIRADALHRYGCGAGGPMQPNMRICQHCGTPYDWRRSPSAYLKMTYCGTLCEKADLGFTIETLLREFEFVRGSWRTLLAA